MNTAKIREFKQHIKDNLLPLDQQETQIRKGEGLINGKAYKLWSADLWTVEICDHLLNPQQNENKYPDDYPTKGELGYQVWNTWKHKTNMYENLIKIKDESDTLVIGEVGRGVDLLLAQMIKDWKRILIYDHAPYEDLLKRFFKGFEYYKTSTLQFITTDKYIKEECIFIINESKFQKWDRLNPYIKHSIYNGELNPHKKEIKMDDERTIDRAIDRVNNSSGGPHEKANAISSLLRAKAELIKAEAMRDIAKSFDNKRFT